MKVSLHSKNINQPKKVLFKKLECISETLNLNDEAWRNGLRSMKELSLCNLVNKNEDHDRNFGFQNEIVIKASKPSLGMSSKYVIKR